jgi:hypothetical protein
MLLKLIVQDMAAQLAYNIIRRGLEICEGCMNTKKAPRQQYGQVLATFRMRNSPGDRPKAHHRYVLEGPRGNKVDGRRSSAFISSFVKFHLFTTIVTSTPSFGSNLDWLNTRDQPVDCLTVLPRRQCDLIVCHSSRITTTLAPLLDENQVQPTPLEALRSLNDQWHIYKMALSSVQQSCSRPIPIKSYQTVFIFWVSHFEGQLGVSLLTTLKNEGVTILSYCLAHRMPPLNSWKQWANLTWGRLCVILVLFDSCVS